jgi:branched-chain amino acid transport system ATP-binding protein
MAILEIKNLSRSFGGLKAVNEVSFNVKAGQIKAVIGPNGAGKTTLFNLVAGGLAPDSGQVFFEGRSATRLPSHRMARLGLARTYQNIKLFPQMTVLENVMVGCHTLGKSGFLKGMFRLPGFSAEEKRIRSTAMEQLSLFGLADKAGLPCSALPFGLLRGVEMARALAMGPKLLLLDEPAAGLNMQETQKLAAQIAGINALGVTILIVEHDMSLVMDISHEIVVLNYGSRIAEGEPRAIQADPEVVRIYLGEEDA